MSAADARCDRAEQRRITRLFLRCSLGAEHLPQLTRLLAWRTGDPRLAPASQCNAAFQAMYGFPPVGEAALRIAQSMGDLQLTSCQLPPSLLQFNVYNIEQPLLIGDGVTAFCAALRASSLQELNLCDVGLFTSLAARRSRSPGRAHWTPQYRGARTRW